MNVKDREQMTNFKLKVDTLAKKQNSLDKKVDKILAVLEDDRYSTSTGLISEVNELNEQVQKLMYVNGTIKRLFWWIMGIFSTIVGFLAKNLLSDA